MKAFADLADLPEDERITIIGRVAEGGNITGIVVEDDVKADRYISKLTARHRIRVIDRHPGPVAGTVLVHIGPAES